MTTTIPTTNPSLSSLSSSSVAADLKSVADAARTDVNNLHAKRVFYARGVVTANVADLTAFTVASNDGLTYAAGDIVLLVGQSTGTQNGLYVVGAVGGGTATLTRISDVAAGDAIVNGTVVHVSEGTKWVGSAWKAMCTGACVWGSNDPLFYPQVQHFTSTLVAGKVDLGNTDDLFLWSTTKSQVLATQNTPNTASSTILYAAPVASRTAGKKGTATVRVQAQVAAGTINTADISTVDVVIINW